MKIFPSVRYKVMLKISLCKVIVWKLVSRPSRSSMNVTRTRVVSRLGLKKKKNCSTCVSRKYFHELQEGVYMLRTACRNCARFICFVRTRTCLFSFFLFLFTRQLERCCINIRESNRSFRSGSQW